MPSVGSWGEPPTNKSMLEPEYAPAYEAYSRTKSPQDADKLLTAISPVLDEATRSYAGGEVNTATTKARAKSLALQAVRRYDPNRAKLRTHLLSHLRGLRRQTERSTSAIYVPEQWRLDSQRTNAVEPELRDELGRDASDAEVADRLSIPVARVRKARATPGAVVSSQVENSGGSFGVPTVDPKAWNAWVEGIYHDLQPVDQIILEHSFGLHGKDPLPANQIAEKVNLSAGAVSHRKARIQGMLDEYQTFMGRFNG